jgi:hypothetical protein
MGTLLHRMVDLEVLRLWPKTQNRKGPKMNECLGYEYWIEFELTWIDLMMTTFRFASLHFISRPPSSLMCHQRLVLQVLHIHCTSKKYKLSTVNWTVNLVDLFVFFFESSLN